MKQGTSLAIGMIIGVALGLATENILLGTGVGIAVSIAAGYRGGRDD